MDTTAYKKILLLPEVRQSSWSFQYNSSLSALLGTRLLRAQYLQPDPTTERFQNRKEHGTDLKKQLNSERDLHRLYHRFKMQA